VPVHTEAGDWFKESFENVVLADGGMRYKFVGIYGDEE
jgi:hypothetical protein